MLKATIIQGKEITSDDVEFIIQLMAEHPQWNRTRLSREICRVWQWHNGVGRIKDMACRSLLLKLERAGHITLPPRCHQTMYNKRKGSRASIAVATEEICCGLQLLTPLQITPVKTGADNDVLFGFLLSNYHYLGHRTTVGENMKYLICDRFNRPLACVLFGAAAWKTAPRDEFIGWDIPTREKHLAYVTNNTRFLILPWVKVPHLASHILARIARRLCDDWMAKYGHPIYLLETFVDTSRFRGTCYRAANWILTGRTQGRTRNDHHNKIKVSPKDIYVYPLVRDFRMRLCHDS